MIPSEAHSTLAAYMEWVRGSRHIEKHAEKSARVSLHYTVEWPGTMAAMSGAQRERSEAERARDSQRIIGSLMHEGYVVTPEAEAVHQRVECGEITSEEAIAIFLERALELDRKLTRQRTDW